MRLIEAAQRVFKESGPNASLDKIAEAAGTTKVTLYSHFPNKDALLEAALLSAYRQRFGFFDDPLDVGDPHGVLLRLAEEYLDLVTNEDLAAIILVLFQGAERAPALAQRFFEQGPAAFARQLTAYLKRIPALKLEHPEFAAEQFIGMIRGAEQTRALLHLPLSRRGARRRAYLQSCIVLFLRAHGHGG
jgi:TetR/AcrR family transcriptional repressor of mexJK operon